MLNALFAKVLTVLLLVLVTDTLCVAQSRQPVKIGLIYPLSGPMSSFGEDMAKAVPLLEKKFNAEQSPYEFVLLLEDGKFGQTNAAISAAKKLVSVDGVKFLVVGSSGEVLQVAPFAESAGVVTVAGFASHPDVKKAGDYIFRTYIDIENGIRLVADDMLEKRVERVAVISEESSFTSAVKRSLENFLEERIVFSEDFAFGDADFNTLITKARARKPEVYYLNVSTPANFITLVRQLRANKVSEPFYTYYTPSLQDVQAALGEKLDGTNYLDFPEATDQTQDFRSFQTDFERQVGRPVRAPFNFKTNYNAVKVLFDAITAVGPDPRRVKDFLYLYDRPSATGRLQFDSNGDAKDLNLVLKSYGSISTSNGSSAPPRAD